MVATTAQTNSCNALGQIGINVPTHHVAITKYRFATIVDLVAMAQGWAFGQQATNASRIVESTQAMPHQTLRSIFLLLLWPTWRQCAIECSMLHWGWDPMGSGFHQGSVDQGPSPNEPRHPWFVVKSFNNIDSSLHSTVLQPKHWQFHGVLLLRIVPEDWGLFHKHKHTSVRTTN